MSDFSGVEILSLPCQTRSLSKEDLACGQRVLWSKNKSIDFFSYNSSGVFYIASGFLLLRRNLLMGKSSSFFIITPGNFICDIRYAIDNTLPVEVLSMSTIEAYWFSGEKIDKLFVSSKNFRKMFLWSIAHKAFSIGIDRVFFATLKKEDHLIYLLRSLANCDSVPVDGGRAICISQSLIADYLGVHRVHLNRLLKNLEEKKFIKRERTRILIFDKNVTE